jgi:hypothetical protein
VREVVEHLPLIHPGADGGDSALGAQARERGKSFIDDGAIVRVGVVHVKDVDALETESLEARLERAGTRTRPTFVDSTNSARGGSRKNAPIRISLRPCP